MNNKTRQWQKDHPNAMRQHKLKWYYKNRTIINLMFSRPKGKEMDEADKYYAQTHPEG